MALDNRIPEMHFWHAAHGQCVREFLQNVGNREGARDKWSVCPRATLNGDIKYLEAAAEVVVSYY